MHCDVDQDDAVDHICQCLEVIGVERVDHGVNVSRTSSLVGGDRPPRLGLTCCPISNRYVRDGLKAREIWRCSTSAACHGQLGRSGLLPRLHEREPRAVQEAVQLTRDNLVQLSRNAFTVSWLSSDDRDRLLELLEEYAAGVESFLTDGMR